NTCAYTCIRTDKTKKKRPIVCEHGHLTASHGSSRFSMGATTVDVSIYGPVEDLENFDSSKIDRAHLCVNVVSINSQKKKKKIKTIKTLNKAGLDTYIEHEVGTAFENIILLQKYPQTTIHIKINVLSTDGSLLSCVLNAVSVALLDSGIDCKTLLSSVCVGYCNQLDYLQNGTESKSQTTEMQDVKDTNTEEAQMLLFDPTERENSILHSLCTIAYSTKLGDKNDMELSYCDIKGKVNMKSLQQLLLYSKSACLTTQFFIKKHFVQSFKALPTIYVSKDLDDA
ncbi:hypothetical protein RFI_00768, partial [Reticulomyxa filosa]